MAISESLKSSGREAALARRRAQSAGGKQGAARPAASPAPVRPAPQARAATPSRPAAAPTPVRQQARVVVSGTGAGRAQAMARRAALARDGRKAERSADRTRAGSRAPVVAAPKPSGKGECGCGCGGSKRSEQQSAPSLSLTAPASPRDRRPTQRRVSGDKPSGRSLSLARRQALSTRGKAALGSQPSAAGLARQANPQLSGRELAQRVRAQRSRNGSSGVPKKGSASRTRPGRSPKGAEDQPWKVGASETTRGQTVTGTRVGRSPKTTGDEPSTCRTITGTEYMGADIFRELCQAEPLAGPEKVRKSQTSHGNRVTGTEVGRSTRVTGDEPGTCKLVTGTEYLAPEQVGAFCGTAPPPGPRKVGQSATLGGKPVSGVLVGRSTKVTGDEAGAGVRPTGTQYTNPSDPTDGGAPPKVGLSLTLSGKPVTGTRVSRSTKVTGDEPGSCRNITGDEYIDLQQYQAFCASKPEPNPPKIGFSVTGKKKVVSGTQTGRSVKVTGDEPGTCKAVTGTPYAGLEQADAWCPPEKTREIEQRTRPLAATPGPDLTGIQPGIGGVMTGAGRGACEPITGTPYVGSGEFAEACGGRGALPGQSDFPQSLDGAPWTAFSIVSPARQAQQARAARGVTGTRYEQGSITGPFGMGTGKITGTEQFRFDRGPNAGVNLLEPPAEGKAPAKSRITGEGQGAGGKITGDDWERGDRVTGTEGRSAVRRNPTRPGPMSARAPVVAKRNEELDAPVSRVTGSSGNTERGALITYSGGARG